jgi:hypothetical protein
MTKHTVQWRDGDLWREVRVDVKPTRNKRCMFRLNGRVYVFDELRMGCEVVTIIDSKWTRFGRVARGCIFLGEGRTYGETMEEQALKEGKWEKPVIT